MNKLREQYRKEANKSLVEKDLKPDSYSFTDDYVFWLEDKLALNIDIVIEIEKIENCLPDGLKNIKDKIDYVRSAYGISGDNGNLFDWLIYEIKKSVR